MSYIISKKDYNKKLASRVCPGCKLLLCPTSKIIPDIENKEILLKLECSCGEKWYEVYREFEKEKYILHHVLVENSTK